MSEEYSLYITVENCQKENILISLEYPFNILIEFRMEYSHDTVATTF